MWTPKTYSLRRAAHTRLGRSRPQTCPGRTLNLAPPQRSDGPDALALKQGGERRLEGKMTQDPTIHGGVSSPEAKAALDCLCVAFGGSAEVQKMTKEEALEEMRAALVALRNPQLLAQLSYWDRHHADVLRSEVAKYLWMGGRA